ncbi:MAG: VOC family protein [Jatrophihabitantaceae bacterium]
MAGEPSYLELGVPDVQAARAFFGALFGWQIQDQGSGGSVQTPTLGIGIHGSDPAAHFEVFFAVTDLADSIDRLTGLGGSTVSEINDSDGFGRWVECRDPQGVRFGLREISG